MKNSNKKKIPQTILNRATQKEIFPLCKMQFDTLFSRCSGENKKK